MVEENFDFPGDTLFSSDMVGLSWASDGIDFDAIKLMAEIDGDQLLTTLEGQQNGVDLTALQQFSQLPVTSQIVEQPVELTNTQLTELSQVAPQFMEQQAPPQVIDSAVFTPLSVQPASPEFFSIVLVDQPSSSLSEESSPVTTIAPMTVTNGSDAVGELDEVKPKKRGRKPKNSTGPVRRQRRPPKTKVYDMLPFADVEAERKRQNAVNAKRHRDMAKQKMADMQSKLDEVIMERDNLKKLVENLQHNEEMLLQKLNQQQQQQEDIFTIEQMLSV